MRGGGAAHGAQTGTEDGVVAADADFYEAFVDGADAGGDLSAGDVAEGVGQVIDAKNPVQRVYSQVEEKNEKACGEDLADEFEDRS